MNVKDTVLTLFTNNFDDTLKANRLPSIIASTAPKMKNLCGDDLYKEYKALSPDNAVSLIDNYDDGIIDVTIGTHSYVAGDYCYFTGSNQSYTGIVLIESVSTTKISVYYSFDGIDVPETFPTALPAIDGLYVTSAKKYDLITSEAYLVLCNLTFMLEEVRDYTPYSESSDFGEGRIYSASNESMAGKRSEFMAEARKLIGRYYVDDDNASYSVKFGSFKGSDTWQT